jgi:hypothetical protein
VRAAATEIAWLRAHADGFAALADKLDELRRTGTSSDTELMRRLIDDCRLWSQRRHCAAPR